jgi:hypothetical protein
VSFVVKKLDLLANWLMNNRKHALIILHPFLVAIYPTATLLAFNLEEVRPSSALRPLIFSMLVTAALLLLARLLMTSWQKAALVTTLGLILFFSYGHVYNSLEQIQLSGFPLGRHRFLAPAWLGFFLLSWWSVHRSKRDLRAANRFLNLAAGLALVFPLIQIGQYTLHVLDNSPLNSTALLTLPQSPDRGIGDSSPPSSNGATEDSSPPLSRGAGGDSPPLSRGAATESVAPADSSPPLSRGAGGDSPDIYYIILDGYARDDILRKFYELDNRDFLDRLRELGFYVAGCSQSNYAQTQLSLASSLNLAYLDSLGADFHAGNDSRAGLPDLIQHSAVRRYLEDSGYKFIAFETGYPATEIRDADLFYSPGAVRGLNDFESLFIRTTAARLLAEGVAALNIKPDWEARDQDHRARILFTLEKLPQIAHLDGPKFVFAHIVAPHWPHVFGPDGEPVHEHQDSASGYRNQVIFINKQIKRVITEILAGSPAPPVIILQADHGSIIESPERRMSILNAYHLPGGGERLLYENISPVNTFRVIFDYYYGADLERLEDISYYSIYDRPYEYTIVKNERPGCP